MFSLLLFLSHSVCVLYKYPWYRIKRRSKSADCSCISCWKKHPTTPPLLMPSPSPVSLLITLHPISSYKPLPPPTSSSSSSSPPLQMHRRQTQYLTPLLASQLLADQTRKSTPNRLAALVYQHASVVVELHHAAVRPRVLLRRPHNHRVPDVAAADFVGC